MRVARGHESAGPGGQARRRRPVIMDQSADPRVDLPGLLDVGLLHQQVDRVLAQLLRQPLALEEQDAVLGGAQGIGGPRLGPEGQSCGDVARAPYSTVSPSYPSWITAPWFLPMATSQLSCWGTKPS